MGEEFKDFEVEAPVLTLEPDLTEEKEEIAAKEPEKPQEPAVEEPVLSPQEQKIVEDFAAKIDIENTNQTLNYNDCTFTIDINKNIIIFPNKLKINEYEVNNSVEVEIEEFDGKKYIPIYLISNLPKVDVKVDGKDIFNNSQLTYTSEALDENRDNHKVVIYTECDDKSLNENYWGESNGSLWREEALKRIEKYRNKCVQSKWRKIKHKKLKHKNEK